MAELSGAADSQTQSSKLAEENETLRAKLEKFEQTQEQRQEQIELLQAEIARLQDVERQGSELREQLVQAQEALRQSQSKADASSAKSEEAEEQIKKLVAELESEKAEAENRGKQYEEMKQGLESEIEKLRSENAVVTNDQDAVLKEKCTQIEKLEHELDHTRSKLSDYESSLGEEFSVDLIQNLQQELAETKMRLSELEASAKGENHMDSDAAEGEPNQEDKGQGLSEGVRGDHVGDDGGANGYVQSEKLDKVISVSAQMVDGREHGGGDNSLQTQVSELEKARKDLQLKVTQLEEKLSGGAPVSPENGMGGDSVDKGQLAELGEKNRHLEEKLAVLGEKHETLVFELEEVQTERDSLQTQLREWDGMMELLKGERDSLAHELDEQGSKDSALRKELEFLLSSLNEAITERDSLQDEVFKLKGDGSVTDDDDSAQGDVREMKARIEDIISERNRLHAELEASHGVKADAAITQEGLRRELEEARRQKEDAEREKDSLLVRFHLAEDNEKHAIAESHAAAEKVAEMEKLVQEIRGQLKGAHGEIGQLYETLENDSSKARVAEDLAEERKSYAVDLENQVSQGFRWPSAGCVW